MATESRRALAPVVTALFSFGLLHAAVALGQVTADSPLGLIRLGEMSEQDVGAGVVGAPRAYGLGFNPNPVGLFLGVTSVLAYSLFVLDRGRWPVAAVALVTFVVTFLGLIATMSRTALFGWLAALFIVSFLSWIGAVDSRGAVLKRACLGLLLVLLAVGTVRLLTSIQATPEQRLNLDEVSSGLHARIADWERSLPIIRDHLGVGIGAGNYPIALKEKLLPEAFGPRLAPIHNVFLLLLAELGVLGAGAWVLIMVAPLLWILSRRQVQQFEDYPLLWLGPLLVLLFASLFEFGPWATQDARILMLAVLGLWAGGVRSHRSPGSPDKEAASSGI